MTTLAGLVAATLSVALQCGYADLAAKGARVLRMRLVEQSHGGRGSARCSCGRPGRRRRRLLSRHLSAAWQCVNSVRLRASCAPTHAGFVQLRSAIPPRFTCLLFAPDACPAPAQEKDVQYTRMRNPKRSTAT